MSVFEVEIVFALPERQLLRNVLVTPGASVAEAVSKSGLQEAFPDFDIDGLAWGVWGREVPRDQVVKEGDRIEIYRPLAMDPREARRQLALSGQTMGGTDSG